MNSLLISVRKIIGLASLMIAFMAVFTPVLSIYLIWFSALLAGFAGLTGSLVFSAIALLLNMVNVVFLSPLSMALIGGSFFSILITLVVFIASIAIWGLGLRLKFSGLTGPSVAENPRRV